MDSNNAAKYLRKRHLELEAFHLLETYDLRLRVFVETLQGTSGYKSDACAKLQKLKSENEASLARLKHAIGTNSRRCIFDSVWNLSRLKSLYYFLLRSGQFQADRVPRASVVATLEVKNEEILGTEELARCRITTSHFPGILNSHLFNIRSIVTSYAEIVDCPVAERIKHLIDWINTNQSTPRSIKGLRSARNFKPEVLNEVIIEKARMRLPTCDSGDAKCAEIYLTDSYVIIRIPSGKLFGREVVEVAPVSGVNVEEGNDECTFHLLGLGLRKVLITNDAKEREQWLRFFAELRQVKSNY